MDTSETYIKMRRKAVYDLPLKPMYGINPHHYHGDIFVDYRGDFFIQWLDGWLDLPRQDDLQKMVGKHWNELLYDFDKFIRWSESIEEYDNISSMEQLWLAFVMKKKYNKVWANNEWRNGSES